MEKLYDSVIKNDLFKDYFCFDTRIFRLYKKLYLLESMGELGSIDYMKTIDYITMVKEISNIKCDLITSDETLWPKVDELAREMLPNNINYIIEAVISKDKLNRFFRIAENIQARIPARMEVINLNEEYDNILSFDQEESLIEECVREINIDLNALSALEDELFKRMLLAIQKQLTNPMSNNKKEALLSAKYNILFYRDRLENAFLNFKNIDVFKSLNYVTEFYENNSIYLEGERFTPKSLPYLITQEYIQLFDYITYLSLNTTKNSRYHLLLALYHKILYDYKPGIADDFMLQASNDTKDNITKNKILQLRNDLANTPK